MRMPEIRNWRKGTYSKKSWKRPEREKESKEFLREVDRRKQDTIEYSGQR